MQYAYNVFVMYKVPNVYTLYVRIMYIHYTYIIHVHVFGNMTTLNTQRFKNVLCTIYPLMSSSKYDKLLA